MRKIIKFRCKICRKTFKKWNKKSKNPTGNKAYVLPNNRVTCSKRCSKENNRRRIYVK